MNSEIEILLRAHLRVSRELLSLEKREYSDESAMMILRASVRLIEDMRQMEQGDALRQDDRESLREHINVSRRLLRLKAREFRFAYVDPEDGEGGSPIYARMLPVPPSLLGRDAAGLPFDD